MNIFTSSLFLGLFCLLTIPTLTAQPFENSRPEISAEAFYQRGVEFHKAEQFDIAVNYYTEALTLEAGHQSALYNRGLAYYELEKYNKALYDFDWLINTNPNDIALYEQRARVRFLLNDPIGAIEDYNMAMKHAPVSILLVNRGMAENMLENYKQALMDFDKALEEDPYDTEAYINKGDTYFAMGDYHNAIQYYTEALQIYPEDERTINNRANAFAKLGQNDDALLDYNQAVEINPNSYILVNRGFFWLDNDDLEKALADFLESSRLNFKNANAFYGVALVKMETGHLDEAADNIDKAIQLDPENELYLNASANICFQDAAYKEAVHDWERVLELDPANEEALNGIQAAKAEMQDYQNTEERSDQGAAFEDFTSESIAYEVTESKDVEEENFVPIPTYDISLTEELPFPEHEEVPGQGIEGDYYYQETIEPSPAREVFIPKGIPETKAPVIEVAQREDLLELTPSTLLIKSASKPDEAQLLDQANSLLAAARYEEALDGFNSLLNINPNHIEALAGRGKANYKLLNYQEALEDLSRVLAINPELPEVYYTRGNIYFDLKNTHKAISDFSEALGSSPDFADAYFMRGLCYSNLSQYEAALTDFEKCTHLDPENLKAINNLATIKYISGNVFESIEDYNKAIEQFPFEGTLYANRAKVKEHLDLYESALKDCEMALFLLPNKEEYYFLRGVIHQKLGNYPQAIKDISHCIEQSDLPQAEYFYRRALSYHFDGKIDAALGDYDQTILLDPNNAEALFNRGIAYKKQGNSLLACQDFHQANFLRLERAKHYLEKEKCPED